MTRLEELEQELGVLKAYLARYRRKADGLLRSIADVDDEARALLDGPPGTRIEEDTCEQP